MILFCHKCKTPLTVWDNFCRTCGEETSKLTIPPNAQEPEHKEFVHCTHCAKKNHIDALYCSSCGNGIHRTPEGAIVCPECGRKNPAGSAFCTGCTLSFKDWFAMMGKVAHRHGIRGNVTFTEQMTGLSFSFYTANTVTIGRAPANTIAVPCLWLSSQHGVFDIDKGVFIDNNSTNGSFANRKPDRLSSMPFSQIEELNLGSMLTFRTVRGSGLFAIRLAAVMKDSDGCGKCTAAHACENLRNRYLVFGSKGELHIRKFDGEVVPAISPNEPCYTVSLIDSVYYLTDPGRGMRNQLVRKDPSANPENWKIVLHGTV